MDFLSGLVKGGDSKKPGGEEKSSSPDLLASAKIVAEAAQAQYSNQPEKYDKNKAAAAAADLLDAAEGYGKLDETKGVGKYVEQAEDYLRKYGEPKPTAAAASGGEKPAPTTTAAAPEAEGGAGGFMKKAAGEFLNK